MEVIQKKLGEIKLENYGELEGKRIKILVVVSKKERYKDAFRFRVKDSSGSAVIYPYKDYKQMGDEFLKEVEKIKEKDVVVFEGEVSLYSSGISFEYQKFTILSEEEARENLFEIVPSCPVDINILKEEFFSLKNEVQNPYLKVLLNEFFEDKDFFEEFSKKPAAKDYHHNYIGGLLEHTVNVAKLCKTMAESYRYKRKIKKDLLIAGALLHDVGKFYEYTYFPEIDKTKEGILLGHIAIGYEMVKNKIREIRGKVDDKKNIPQQKELFEIKKQHLSEIKGRGSFTEFPEELEFEILHLILSHHGQKEWGSPVIPYTLEAQILHYADLIDSRIWMFEKAEKEAKDKGKEMIYDKKRLSRYVFIGGYEDASEEIPSEGNGRNME